MPEAVWRIYVCDICGMEVRVDHYQTRLPPKSWYHISQRQIKGDGRKEAWLCSPRCLVQWRPSQIN